MLTCVSVFKSVLVVMFFVFFFSSRRRHTRCLSDWSSDVCSSDLYVERVEYPQYGGVGSYLGSYNFRGQNVLNPHDAGDGWANAYLGQLNSYSEGQRSVEDMWQWDVEWFVQDNWRVTRRLTLDLGVRFYHMPPETDHNDTASVFVASTYNPAAAERIYYQIGRAHV